MSDADDSRLDDTDHERVAVCTGEALSRDTYEIEHSYLGMRNP